MRSPGPSPSLGEAALEGLQQLALEDGAEQLVADRSGCRTVPGPEIPPRLGAAESEAAELGASEGRGESETAAWPRNPRRRSRPWRGRGRRPSGRSRRRSRGSPAQPAGAWVGSRRASSRPAIAPQPPRVSRYDSASAVSTPQRPVPAAAEASRRRGPSPRCRWRRPTEHSHRPDRDQPLRKAMLRVCAVVDPDRERLVQTEQQHCADREGGAAGRPVDRRPGDLPSAAKWIQAPRAATPPASAEQRDERGTAEAAARRRATCRRVGEAEPSPRRPGLPAAAP